MKYFNLHILYVAYFSLCCNRNILHLNKVIILDVVFNSLVSFNDYCLYPTGQLVFPTSQFGTIPVHS